jgi:hypothetical protein
MSQESHGNTSHALSLPTTALFTKNPYQKAEVNFNPLLFARFTNTFSKLFKIISGMKRSAQ